ncbi:hypothetical protein DL96DRAFT_206594 [Flagelloscypha sp. PMI_526]|nr:hypothetical protein DL96DRAFT_206594 [Flagelloscypha sp. PMI_526]
MRFVATLACALAASVSVASAARIQGRNAQRMARGLPPLPPRMSSRTGTARRNTPSGIPQPSFDSSFEDDPSGSPWVYGPNTKRGEDSVSTRANTGSHFGLMQVTDGIDQHTEGQLEHPLTLVAGASYTLIFSENFQVTHNGGSCNNYVRVGDVDLWLSEMTSSATPSQYTLHTITFTAPGPNPTLKFYSSCSYMNYNWLIDDVSVTMSSSPLR